MKKSYRLIQIFIYSLLLTSNFFLFADDSFGYLSYSTHNIGDDIQSVAARKFLPRNRRLIDREFIASYKSEEKLPTLINGWFMHTKDAGWVRSDIHPPEKSWPPSSHLDPLLISIFLDRSFVPEALSKEGVDYLKKHAPIGARDYATLEKLQALDIPSYFSGCLTLTLDNPYRGEREDVIYAVDISDECLDYLKRNTRCRVVNFTHVLPKKLLFSNDPERRFAYAQKILDIYAKAKCVVTHRLHATLPCLALQTPVLFIYPDDERLNGLKELAWHCTENELLSEKVRFDFDHPPENPKDYLVLREQLIKKVRGWVEEKSSSYIAE